MPENLSSERALTMIDTKVKNTFVLTMIIFMNVIVFLSLLSYSAEDTHIITGGVKSPDIENWIGLLGAHFSYLLIISFGLVAYPAIFLLILCSLRQTFGRVHRYDWRYISCIILFVLGSCILLGGEPSFMSSLADKLNISSTPGGALGAALNHPVHGWLNAVLNHNGSIILSSAMIVPAVIVVWLYDWNHFFKHKVLGLREKRAQAKKEQVENDESGSETTYDPGEEQNGPGTIFPDKAVTAQKNDTIDPVEEKVEKLEQPALFADTEEDIKVEEKEKEHKTFLNQTRTIVSKLPTVLNFLKVKQARPLNTIQREFVAKKIENEDQDEYIPAIADPEEALEESPKEVKKSLKALIVKRPVEKEPVVVSQEQLDESYVDDVDEEEDDDRQLEGIMSYQKQTDDVEAADEPIEELEVDLGFITEEDLSVDLSEKQQESTAPIAEEASVQNQKKSLSMSYTFFNGVTENPNFHKALLNVVLNTPSG